MYISSRATGTVKKEFKNKFWKWFFSFNITKDKFKKFQEKVKIEKVEKINFLGFDYISTNSNLSLENSKEMLNLLSKFNSEQHQINSNVNLDDIYGKIISIN